MTTENADIENSAPAPAKAPKAAPEKVIMTDGREVEFTGKKRILKESFFTSEGHVSHIRFDFRNGKTINFQIPHKQDASGVWIAARLAAHGAEQKLGDEAAGNDDVDDAYSDIKDTADRLSTGEWYADRKGGVAGVSLLILALMEAQGKTEDQVRAFLKDKSAAQKVALQGHPKVKPIFLRLQEEKAAKSSHVNADELLGQLDAA